MLRQTPRASVTGTQRDTHRNTKHEIIVNEEMYSDVDDVDVRELEYLMFKFKGFVLDTILSFWPNPWVDSWQDDELDAEMMDWSVEELDRYGTADSDEHEEAIEGLITDDDEKQHESGKDWTSNLNNECGRMCDDCERAPRAMVWLLDSWDGQLASDFDLLCTPGWLDNSMADFFKNNWIFQIYGLIGVITIIKMNSV